MLVSAPEDYGLDAEETLAFREDRPPPEGFDAFWATFAEAIDTLPQRFGGAVDGGVNTVIIPSLRSVRVTGRLTMPEVEPRGVVVTTHGYGASDDFPEDPEPWTERGLATLRLRVRGYPPSTQDVDDLRGAWILHRLGPKEAADAWVVHGAVADVVQACRTARAHFAGLPLGLHGESLGGGLAVLAAAQLARLGTPPDRLAVGLPSLGAWRWRAGKFCSGSGALVNEMLVGARADRHRLMATLELHDAALHARSVGVPVLAKLAGRDDVVPAPSAAAVVNGLASDTVLRWRTAFGHYDGGIADARRHVRFEHLHTAFLDQTVPIPEVAGQIAALPS